jgi:hypothetical protein
MKWVGCAIAGNTGCIVDGNCTLGSKLVVDVLLELYWNVVLPCWPA